jgi:3-ketosteroid 9alpha-monooxygenase subunit B
MLEVREVVQETADAVSLLLAAAGPDPAALDYRPGQFLTLRIPRPDGSAVGRCYSLSSSPFAPELLKVTVKRTRDGYGSNWLCDNACAGQRIDSFAPAGLFVPSDLDADLLLIAGGSGVTPMLSILTSALLKGRGRIVLIYVNSDAASVIFAAELARLAHAYPERLSVVHWLTAERGRPTVSDLRALAAPCCAYSAFICGPAGLMATAGEALRANGMPRERITLETFASLVGDPFAPVAARPEATGQDGDARLELDLYGDTHDLAWPRGMVLLDLLMTHGIEVAYSCREGLCGTCICVIERGRVRMLRNQVLSAVDLAEGYVLACQSLPDAADCKIVF